MSFFSRLGVSFNVLPASLIKRLILVGTGLVHASSVGGDDPMSDVCTSVGFPPSRKFIRISNTACEGRGVLMHSLLRIRKTKPKSTPLRFATVILQRKAFCLFSHWTYTRLTHFLTTFPGLNDQSKPEQNQILEISNLLWFNQTWDLFGTLRMRTSGDSNFADCPTSSKFRAMLPFSDTHVDQLLKNFRKFARQWIEELPKRRQKLWEVVATDLALRYRSTLNNSGFLVRCWCNGVPRQK